MPAILLRAPPSFRTMRRFCEDILDQKIVHTKSVYTNSLSKIYQNYAILLAKGMSSLQKELSATELV